MEFCRYDTTPHMDQHIEPQGSRIRPMWCTNHGFYLDFKVPVARALPHMPYLHRGNLGMKSMHSIPCTWYSAVLEVPCCTRLHRGNNHASLRLDCVLGLFDLT